MCRVQCPTDVALESAGASCVTSNSDDPWARGNDCARLIKGTDLWSADTGVHVAKLTGGNYSWLKITFAQPSAIHSVTVKQCSHEDPAFVSQNFKIESFDSAGEYKTLHAYAGSGVDREETYTLPSPTMPAAGVRLTITAETKPDNWWRLQAVQVMGAAVQVMGAAACGHTEANCLASARAQFGNVTGLKFTIGTQKSHPAPDDHPWYDSLFVDNYNNIPSGCSLVVASGGFAAHWNNNDSPPRVDDALPVSCRSE